MLKRCDGEAQKTAAANAAVSRTMQEKADLEMRLRQVSADASVRSDAAAREHKEHEMTIMRKTAESEAFKVENDRLTAELSELRLQQSQRAASAAGGGSGDASAACAAEKVCDGSEETAEKGGLSVEAEREGAAGQDMVDQADAQKKVAQLKLAARPVRDRLPATRGYHRPMPGR